MTINSNEDEVTNLLECAVIPSTGDGITERREGVVVGTPQGDEATERLECTEPTGSNEDEITEHLVITKTTDKVQDEGIELLERAEMTSTAHHEGTAQPEDTPKIVISEDSVAGLLDFGVAAGDRVQEYAEMTSTSQVALRDELEGRGTTDTAQEVVELVAGVERIGIPLPPSCEMALADVRAQLETEAGGTTETGFTSALSVAMTPRLRVLSDLSLAADVYAPSALKPLRRTQPGAMWRSQLERALRGWGAAYTAHWDRLNGAQRRAFASAELIGEPGVVMPTDQRVGVAIGPVSVRITLAHGATTLRRGVPLLWAVDVATPHLAGFLAALRDEIAAGIHPGSELGSLALQRAANTAIKASGSGLKHCAVSGEAVNSASPSLVPTHPSTSESGSSPLSGFAALGQPVGVRFVASITTSSGANHCLAGEWLFIVTAHGALPWPPGAPTHFVVPKRDRAAEKKEKQKPKWKQRIGKRVGALLDLVAHGLWIARHAEEIEELVGTTSMDADEFHIELVEKVKACLRRR